MTRLQFAAATLFHTVLGGAAFIALMFFTDADIGGNVLSLALAGGLGAMVASPILTVPMHITAKKLRESRKFANMLPSLSITSWFTFSLLGILFAAAGIWMTGAFFPIVSLAGLKSGLILFILGELSIAYVAWYSGFTFVIVGAATGLFDAVVCKFLATD